VDGGFEHSSIRPQRRGPTALDDEKDSSEEDKYQGHKIIGPDSSQGRRSERVSSTKRFERVWDDDDEQEVDIEQANLVVGSNEESNFVDAMLMDIFSSHESTSAAVKPIPAPSSTQHSATPQVASTSIDPRLLELLQYVEGVSTAVLGST
jgi:hypothetical protein